MFPPCYAIFLTYITLTHNSRRPLKLLLLEAEHLFQEGSELALGKYKASIIAARNHRFIHEEGLAYSKLGHYHIAQGRETDAAHSFTKAEECYEKWGMHSLVKHNMENEVMAVQTFEVTHMKVDDHSSSSESFNFTESRFQYN